MIGEFKVDLKEYNQEKLTALFDKEYQNTLDQAYTKSSFKDGKTYPQSSFCSGAFAGSKLLLICKLQADMLRCIVETPGDSNMNELKKAINLYYSQVTKILKKNKIKWREPLSTITVESYPCEGTIKGLGARLKDLF